MSEKLQKVLARAGLGSRREIETWIKAGRVSVDGKRAEIGARVEGTERVRVDGRVVARSSMEGSKRRVLLYHKPEGEVCTRSDPEGRPTIFERLPHIKTGRWIAVGRLDVNTMGVLLLTTDGELAHRLMHPSFDVERIYSVRVLGEIEEGGLRRLTQGIELEDGPARFDTLVDSGGEGANHWYQVSVKEGRNREVRRMWESQGVRVSRLIRVQFGPVSLPRDLPRGRWLELGDQQVRELARFAEMAVDEPEEGPAPRTKHATKPRQRGDGRPDQSDKHHSARGKPGRGYNKADRGGQPGSGRSASPWKGRSKPASKQRRP